MRHQLKDFETVNKRFGHVFRQALQKAYGELPSAAFVATQFNLRCKHDSAVSQESTRRWIRGYSIPDPERLLILSNWLDIDYNTVFNAQRRPTNHRREDLILNLLVSLVAQIKETGEIPSSIFSSHS